MHICCIPMRRIKLEIDVNTSKHKGYSRVIGYRGRERFGPSNTNTSRVSALPWTKPHPRTCGVGTYYKPNFAANGCVLWSIQNYNRYPPRVEIVMVICTESRHFICQHCALSIMWSSCPASRFVVTGASKVTKRPIILIHCSWSCYIWR